MSIESQFQTLFAYHWHTNLRLIDLAIKLDESQIKEKQGYGRGSIRDLFFHLLRADQSWRIGLETGRQASPLRQGDFPDLKSIRTGFEHERGAWQELLDSFDTEQIAGDISIENRRGESYSFPRWRILQHVLFHGMQHHSELAQLLTAKGKPPGDIDFIFYEG
ncbi:MAG: hypothetical protein GTO14_06300 [Anaerolineales bacterium]|nr:hypothetical protein [Anaerolineales bacterium]